MNNTSYLCLSLEPNKRVREMEIEITALWIKGNTAIVGSLILWGRIRHTYPPNDTHSGTEDRPP